MVFLITLFFFAFGLIIGSFLNVVICRLNTSRSLGGRSACMSCQSQLCWYELIPFFSFLGLRGRCRTCQTNISIQYPIVELITGVVFAILFIKFSQGILYPDLSFIASYLYYAVMFSILIVVMGYDFKHKIIPDSLSLIFGILAFVGMFFFNQFGSFHFQVPSILELLSGVFVALPFALLWLVSRGAWMGLGDAKLALGLGWFLGLAVGLSGLVLAFWIGTIVGVGLIVFKKGYGMKSEIPFAPYLVLGAFIAFILELNLFSIYL